VTKKKQKPNPKSQDQAAKAPADDKRLTASEQRLADLQKRALKEAIRAKLKGGL